MLLIPPDGFNYYVQPGQTAQVQVIKAPSHQSHEDEDKKKIRVAIPALSSGSNGIVVTIIGAELEDTIESDFPIYKDISESETYPSNVVYDASKTVAVRIKAKKKN
ncbi:MAG: hypothetical protein P9L92_06720 [Candidatus Electryonea clarkiae]|nr:hypothetical protein [Candidatus Electryonea clarkiae]MDP8286734.1 hypothetical protein [Candidatus Electryonea clarkiae]